MFDCIEYWPSLVDYRKILRNGSDCFEDPDLKDCHPVLNDNDGRPRIWPGGFAVVFKLVSKKPNRPSWALRCFTRKPDEDVAYRYKAINSHFERCLETISLLVEFEYLERGIIINENWYPVLKMEWVEGLTLDNYLEKLIIERDRYGLHCLFNNLLSMQKKLQEAEIAHGDLQHGNIMILADNQLKLIDYDGMYVPELAGSPPKNEAGHPNYQHPKRNKSDFGLSMDAFSFDVIMLSILALYKDTTLWGAFRSKCKGYTSWENFCSRMDDELFDEKLLFEKKDFEDPENSTIFSKLIQHQDNRIRLLAERLFQECLKPPRLEFKVSDQPISQSDDLTNENIPEQGVEENADILSDEFNKLGQSQPQNANEQLLNKASDSISFKLDNPGSIKYDNLIIENEYRKNKNKIIKRRGKVKKVIIYLGLFTMILIIIWVILLFAP